MAEVDNSQSPANSQGKALDASLIGWYGRENAGDDAFFAVLCKWLLTATKVEQISVSGADAKLPNLSETLPGKIFGNEPSRPLGRFQRFANEPKRLFGYDVVIFGGGSIFTRRRFWWLAVQLWFLKVLRSLRLCPTAVAGIGVSLGPFRRFGDSFWCKKALQQFDVVMVRDARSWEIGKSFGLKNLLPSHDLALVLPHYYAIPERKKKEKVSQQPTIGFSVVDRDTEFGESKIDDTKRSAIAKALLQVVAEYPQARVQGFVFCKHLSSGDFIATRKVLQILEDAGCDVEIVEYGNNPVRLCEAISQLDVMVCNRMHSFVFSCITRTPAVMISYAPKMVEFGKTVQASEEIVFFHDCLEAGQLAKTLIRLIQEQTVPCSKESLEACRGKVLGDLDVAVSLLREKNPALGATDIPR